MRKAIIALTIAGSAVAAAIPVHAAKAPKQLTLYLRQEANDDNTCAAPYLSTEDGPDSGNSCAYIFQAGQEAFITTGAQPPLTWSFTGVLEKPVKLSAGSLGGELTVNYQGSQDGKLEIVASAATSKGQTTQIGSFTSEAFTGPTGKVPVTLDLKMPKSLVGKKVSTITLSATFRGTSVSAYIEKESPASFITLPIK